MSIAHHSTIIIAILLFLSLQEHTGSVFGVQYDNFQVVSCSDEGTIVIYNFLDLVPPDPICALGVYKTLI